MNSDSSDEIIESDISAYEETDKDNDSPIQKRKSWRKKYAIIESDSENESDDIIDCSDDETSGRNVTQMISHSESFIAETSDSDDSENHNDSQHQKRHDSREATPNTTASFYDSKKKTGEYDVTSDSGYEKHHRKQSDAYAETRSLKSSASVCTSKEEGCDSGEISGSDNTADKQVSPISKEDNVVNLIDNSLDTEEEVEEKDIDEKENVSSGKFEEKLLVTEAVYLQQYDRVAQFQKNLSALKSSLATVNINHLKDKGKSLLDREKLISSVLAEESNKLDRMKISQVPKSTTSATLVPTWAELQRDVALVQPKTFGKQAIKTADNQRAITMEGLRNLHNSLEERPGEDVLADTPSQCKVQLMEHQRHGLAFMVWREQKKPSGGLLADDMGLGKTLTVISLCLATLDASRKAQGSKEWKSKDRGNRPAGVLVVCPASVMGQWVKEVKERVRKNTLDVLEYHGTNRHQDVRLLHRVDIVLTTYATLSREFTGNTEIYQLKWHRVVLDEAHQVRNHKTQASQAVCALRAQSRWALTGTPIHNQEIDMFGIFKFLHCEPFDDLVVFKRWVGNKRTGGSQRLQSALQALMLRRTKADMIESGALCTFPERVLETIRIAMDPEEQRLYHNMMVFSRSLFAQFLQQRADKLGLQDDPKKFDKYRRDLMKTNQYGQVKQSQILVLLLRLRQICIHPTLMTKMLETTDIETVVEEEPKGHDEMVDVLDQLNKLQLRDNDGADESLVNESLNLAANEDLTVNDAVKNVFNKDNPVFDSKRKSSKVRILLKLLKEKIIPTGSKSIVVSQWTSLLKLIAAYLEEDGIPFCSLDGTVKIPDRQSLIDQLNSAKHPCKVMLLSLTAGGVGLNLVGANHLLIMDPHWNPQLELQAQDRIYRVGQQKKVHIYRLLASDSIEERIIELQNRKMEVSQAMLTGGRITGNKLSMDDLKMLFNM